MPFPVEHHYVTVIGDSYNATERWQFGFRLTDGGLSNEVTALAISDDVERWFRSDAVSYPVNFYGVVTSHRLLELKVAKIGVDGKYPPDEPSYSHFYLPAIAGTAAKPGGQSAQQTVAVTLTTALPRGLASKGRMYLPPSARMNTQADGLMVAADAAAIAESVKTLINEVNANAQVGNVAIFSRGRGVPSYDAENNRIEYTYPNPGAFQVVTGVRVGRVIDTQRRRRRSLNEQPQVVAL